MKTKIMMLALTLLTTGTVWGEDFPKDSLKVVDMEEVVVIATPKENRKLRELPIAATVLSQENMCANQVHSVKNLTGIVPNLFIPDYGSKLTTSIYIRGIGSRINTPSVGLYVDNIPYIDKSAFDFNYCDIERIDVLRGTHKQAVCIAVRSGNKGCIPHFPAVIQRNVLLSLLERGAVITFCAAAALGLELQKQAVRAGVELVQHRCAVGHALGNHQRFVRTKMEAGVLRPISHSDGFTADRVCSFFAQVVAACIQGRIVPVIGARNNIVAAGDPLRYRLGNAVGFLVNRGY